MKKYRRIEVNAYRRHITIVSGEWRPSERFESAPVPAEGRASLNDTDECEPIAPDSPEGQLILVEAIRTLECRLSPESRALICNESRHSQSKPDGFNSEKEKGQ